MLSKANTKILIDLHAHGSRQPSQLADHLGVSRQRVTKLLDQLDGQHLIHRKAGVASDRRVTTVTLTPHGRQVIGAANRILAEGFEDIGSVTHWARKWDAGSGAS